MEKHNDWTDSNDGFMQDRPLLACLLDASRRLWKLAISSIRVSYIVMFASQVYSSSKLQHGFWGGYILAIIIGLPNPRRSGARLYVEQENWGDYGTGKLAKTEVGRTHTYQGAPDIASRPC